MPVPFSTQQSSYTVFNVGSLIVGEPSRDSGLPEVRGTAPTNVTQTCIDNLTTGLIYIKENVGNIGTLTHKAGVVVVRETIDMPEFGQSTITRDSSGRISIVTGRTVATITRDSSGRIASITTTWGTKTVTDTINRDSTGRISSVMRS